MKRDSRLSVALHSLLHMSELEGMVTSEKLASLMVSSSVVFRRTMGGLRKAGIVRAEKGHGGGWQLARTLDQITLGDVYEALSVPTPFNIGPRDESPGCLVEQAVNRAIGHALDEAEARLMIQLRAVSLADLASDIQRNHSSRKKRPNTHV